MSFVVIAELVFVGDFGLMAELVYLGLSLRTETDYLALCFDV